MKSFLSPNIDTKGRIVRGLGALVLLAGSAWAFTASAWLGAALLATALFVGFEAVRGWCFLRACGLKTKL